MNAGSGADDEITISFERATETSVRSVERLFALSGAPKSTQLLAWQYLDGPGPAYVAVAHDGRGTVDGAVAAYSAFPVPYKLGDRVGTALQSFDTLTLPSHRGRGLFVRLAREVYRRAAEAGELAVFGFPNDSSVHGFAKHLGWTIDGPAPLRIRPIGARYLRVRSKLRHPKALTPSASRAPQRVLAEVGAAIANLYSELESGNYVGTRHTLDYLSWRLRRPGNSYSLHYIGSGSSGIQAFGVTELLEKHGCSLGYIMGFVVAPSAKGDGRALMREMIGDLQQRGADLVFMWDRRAGSTMTNIAPSGFVEVPQRLRPIKLNFGGVVLGPNRQHLEFPGRCEISYLDSDTV